VETKKTASASTVAESAQAAVNLEPALARLRRAGIKISAKRITTGVNFKPGLKLLGTLEFLMKHGYTVAYLANQTEEEDN
jgi:hypothetical protein